VIHILRWLQGSIGLCCGIASMLWISVAEEEEALRACGNGLMREGRAWVDECECVYTRFISVAGRCGRIVF
jgi:hypothetical protein